MAVTAAFARARVNWTGATWLVPRGWLSIGHGRGPLAGLDDFRRISPLNSRRVNQVNPPDNVAERAVRVPEGFRSVDRIAVTRVPVFDPIEVPAFKLPTF